MQRTLVQSRGGQAKGHIPELIRRRFEAPPSGLGPEGLFLAATSSAVRGPSSVLAASRRPVPFVDFIWSGTLVVQTFPAMVLMSFVGAQAILGLLFFRAALCSSS